MYAHILEAKMCALSRKIVVRAHSSPTMDRSKGENIEILGTPA